MSQPENLIDVVGLLLRRRRIVLQVTAVAAAIGILTALLLPVYYRASTTFLAASPDQTNPTKIFRTGETVSVYGTGNDIERLIGVANSEETIGFLVDSFDLYTVYDIPRDHAKARRRVREELSDLYEVTRTRYDEVEIAVEDRDPERAAAMANAARNRMEQVVRAATSTSRDDLAQAFRNTISAKEQRRRALSDTLRALSDAYGIVNVQTQSAEFAGLLGRTDRDIAADSASLAVLKAGRRLTPRLRDTVAVITARIEAQREGRRQLVGQLESFQRGSGRVQAAQIEYDYLASQLTYDRERLRQIEALNQGRGAIIHLLDRAYVPDTKSRPVRWLIVVGTTAAAFVLAVLGVLLYENYKAVEWRRYLRD